MPQRKLRRTLYSQLDGAERCYFVLTIGWTKLNHEQISHSNSECSLNAISYTELVGIQTETFPDQFLAPRESELIADVRQ